MQTIASCLRRSYELSEVSESPRLDAEVLLGFVLNQSRTYLYTWPEKTLSEQEYAVFGQYLSRRQRGEPIAYITGEKEFWSLALKVNSSVLIPRPETELLIETALALLPVEEQTVIDLGTGSGAIALALASERRDWQIYAVEKSTPAITLARENGLCHQLEQVQWIQSEWLTAFNPQPGFDLVLSNPPYIDSDDPHLQQGDVRFEPTTALVAPDQGLLDIQVIASQAMSRLNQNGWLIVEHGYQQGDAVRKIFTELGYCHVTTFKDLAGQERVTQGQKSDE